MRETFAAAVLDSLTAQIAVLDSNGIIVTVNRAWRRFAQENGGADTAFYVGANYLAVCEQGIGHNHDETIRGAFQGILAVLHGELDSFAIEYPCHSPTEQRWFIGRATRLRGDPEGHVVISHENITASKLSEHALREAEQTLRDVLESLPVGVWIMDHTGRIVHGNPVGQHIWAGARYVGPEQFGEYKGWWLSTGERIAADEWAAARAIQKGETSIDEEIEIECFDGTRKIILNSAIPLFDTAHDIKGAVIVNQDITARKKAEAELRRAKAAAETANEELHQALARERLLANTDALTGVNNRRHFWELAKHEFAAARRYRHPLSIILFDVDRFKQINDTFGHAVGDEVIQCVARITQEHVRQPDILARYGGEEFIVLLPNSSAPEAATVAERVRGYIADHRAVCSHGELGVTISAGVAELHPDEDDLDAVIQRADRALYMAKESGRDRVVTCPQVDSPVDS